mmetsp:Transcript_4671/g.7228  ORF Transcript_4671/g.7228 Transcript_4671/m.7228 type:complete len:412 (+) Transcript_4671:84-1319(+)
MFSRRRIALALFVVVLVVPQVLSIRLIKSTVLDDSIPRKVTAGFLTAGKVYLATQGGKTDHAYALQVPIPSMSVVTKWDTSALSIYPNLIPSAVLVPDSQMAFFSMSTPFAFYTFRATLNNPTFALQADKFLSSESTPQYEDVGTTTMTDYAGTRIYVTSGMALLQLSASSLVVQATIDNLQFVATVAVLSFKGDFIIYGGTVPSDPSVGTITRIFIRDKSNNPTVPVGPVLPVTRKEFGGLSSINVMDGNVFAVALVNPNDVYGVPTLLKYFLDNTTIVNSLSLYDLSGGAVAMAGPNNIDLYVAGSPGTIVHVDMKRWVVMDTKHVLEQSPFSFAVLDPSNYTNPVGYFASEADPDNNTPCTLVQMDLFTPDWITPSATPTARSGAFTNSVHFGVLLSMACMLILLGVL